MRTQEKVLSVESIRGVACFMVLLSHLSLTFFPYLHAFSGEADPVTNPVQALIHESPFGFFFSGTSAVYIFFVLSGFILTRVALRNGGAPSKIFSMTIKRYPRLMIPAFASCLIAYASFLCFDISSPELSAWINRYGSGEGYSLFDAAYNGMVEVFVNGKSAYNPVLWTMQIELFGSFVVYALCLNRITYRIPFLMGITIFLTSILVVLKIIRPDFGLGLVSFYGGYLFGIYGRPISIKIATVLIVLGLYLAGAHNTSSSYNVVFELFGDSTYRLCNFASGFLIVYAIIFNNRFTQAFSGKIPVFMGKVSFSVYLIHLPILSTFGVYSFNIIFEATGLYELSAFLTSILSITVIYICAQFFYKAIDYRGMVISNTLAKSLMRPFHSFS